MRSLTSVGVIAVLALAAIQTGLSTVGTADAAAVSSAKTCTTNMQIRLAKRMLKIGRPPRCLPPVASSRSSSRSSVSSSRSSSLSSSMSSSRSSSVSSSSASTDMMLDTSVRSQFLALGETGPVMGAFKVFLYEEPLNITAVQINADITGPAIDSFLIYNQYREYLGRATATASTPTIRTYKLQLQNGTLTVPQREEMNFYARPVLMSYDAGGQGGLVARIHNVVFDGNGYWSNHAYTTASVETFVDFQTARGIITSVKNAGATQEFLLSGTDRKVGSFTFTAHKNDGRAEVKLTNLNFTVEQAGNVALSNVRIGMDGDSTRYNCSVSGSQVTCNSLSDIGVIDGSKTYNVYADVTIPGGTNNASLRLTLNEGGSVSTPGSVTWTDGTTSFNWLPTSGGSVASGTLYKY